MRDVTWLLVLGLVFGGFMIHRRMQERERVEAATAQVKRWADQLDSETTSTGVYVRHKGDRLPESDPWGTPLRVGYSQGGLAETVVVTSAGADKVFDTTDDIERTGIAMNFKGVGEGIRKNAGEVAERSARGAMHGAIVGVKEGLKDVFSSNRGQDDVKDD